MNEKSIKDMGIKSKGFEVFQMVLVIIIAFLSVVVVIFISYAGIPFITLYAGSPTGIILIGIFALELIVLRYLIIRYMFGPGRGHIKSKES